MASAVALQRLRKEYAALQKKPVESIRAAPSESNILEWHYVLEGAKGSPFEGGFYHGTVIFPSEYPFKPPSIMMLTPNGRFETNTRLCLSMSDFHAETWNPMWSVGTILMGLYSFMNEDQQTQGSIVTSAACKRKHAIQSLDLNVRNKKFAELFPELVQLQQERAAAAAVSADVKPSDASSSVEADKGSEGLLTAASILVALLATAYVLVRRFVL